MIQKLRLCLLSLLSLGKSLSDNIPKTNKYIFPSELVNSNTFYLYPISISEIVNVVKKLRYENF